MRAPVATLVLPAYLLLCLMLGGSIRSVWPNMVVQLGAVALILCAVFTRPTGPTPRAAHWLMLIACAALALFAIQLIPLPASVSSSFPGRDVLVRGFTLLREPAPSLPLSLAPYATLSASLALLPPIAVFAAAIRLPQDERLLLAAIIVGAVANVILAALQITSEGRSSVWYLYAITNDGAVGLFANSNHLGTLLVVALAFAAGWVSAQWGKAGEGRTRALVLLIGFGALSIVSAGLALNHSLAALALAVPVAMLSAFLFPAQRRLRQLAFGAGAFVALLVLAVILTGNPLSEKLSGHDVSSLQTRLEIWANTLDLIRWTFPVGTGFGSFDAIYPLVENPYSVDRFFVNHAHNDYLEVVLEGGFAGLALLIAFLWWWMVHAIRAWRSDPADAVARAAVIATGAMLAHSLVDYPLRTAALSAVFALCLALMVRKPAVKPARGSAMSRPPRHVRIG